MKRALILFGVLTALQLAFYSSDAPHQISSLLGGWLWYLLLPGFLTFMFVPVSPEIYGRHPFLVIFPALTNSMFYTAIASLLWLMVGRLRKGKVQ